MHKKNILFAIPIFLFVVAGGVFFLAQNSRSIIDQKHAVINQDGAKPLNPTKNLNIIVLDICSLRADHMSLYGYNRQTTPYLYAFAKNATVFENVWTQSGWCLPNFGTIQTGTRPEIHNLVSESSKLPDNLKTLAGIYQKFGFKTASFSGSKYMRADYGLERGFVDFVNKYQPSEHAHAVSFEENLNDIHKWLYQNKSNPFFLYLTVDDIHSPYQADDVKMYDKDYAGILDKISPDILFNRFYNNEDTSYYNLSKADTLKYRQAIEEFKKDPRNLRNLVARYDAAINRADRLVGEFLNDLKVLGLDNNSIIIITAHQGELLGENGLLGHVQSIYEPILRVPLIVYDPRFSDRSGFRLSNLIERIDISATILDANNLLMDNKNQFVGQSLLPLLKDANAYSKSYIFASSKPNRGDKVLVNNDIEERAVFDGQYKLLQYDYKPNKYELYDLKSDPKEKNNLITQLPEVAEKLKNALQNEYK